MSRFSSLSSHCFQKRRQGTVTIAPRGRRLAPTTTTWIELRQDACSRHLRPRRLVALMCSRDRATYKPEAHGAVATHSLPREDLRLFITRVGDTMPCRRSNGLSPHRWSPNGAQRHLQNTARRFDTCSRIHVDEIYPTQLRINTNYSVFSFLLLAPSATNLATSTAVFPSLLSSVFSSPKTVPSATNP